jgi:molybdopterin/thiamine biosynthesis adenylyltransferase
MLNEDELSKYNRQIIISNIGIEGQEKLKSSKVLIIGLGGLGSSVAYYLTSAGIGYLGLLDKDKVELSNLNRQILHYESDVGKSKTESAFSKLSKLNSDIRIEIHEDQLSKDNIENIIKDYDFIVEASDNFETKFLVNDTCIKLGIPFVIGGVFQFEGQMITVLPKETACYRCVFKEIPTPGTYPTTGEEGVMGTTAGFFGLIEANEAIKFLVFKDKGRLLADKILHADLQYNSFDTFDVEKDLSCICKD